MSRVWWVNQSQSYDQERRAGIIYAGHDKDDPARRRVKEVGRGDIVVHNSDAHIRSLSRVQSNPEPRTPGVHDGPGDVADVEYFDLDDPVYFRDFAAEVYGLDIPEGPIQQNHDGSFGVRQGYCYAFSHRALKSIRDRTSSWPSWQELHPEAQYPSTTQEATDVGGVETSSQKEDPERTQQTVARIIRDSTLARQVKEQAEYRCQVCGEPPIELPDGSLYAEAHHVKPLSKGGPDEEENIVCVCPSCHVKLDYGTIPLTHENLGEGTGSPVGVRFVEYHNRQIAGRS
jgi:5-methylcytosine-specific restriction endonuclease McrA